jgi:hypothetical protein
MRNVIEPDEAGKALTEISRRQEQVIDAASVPSWYWWVVAAASVALGLVADGRDPVAIGVVAVIYAIGVAVLTVWVIVGGVRHVKVNERMLGPEGAGLIIGFIGLVVVGTLAIAFALRSAGVAQAGTLSTLVCGVALVIGGPALTSRLRMVMQRHRAEAR